MAEITYEAFQIPTIEYCLELFGLLLINISDMINTSSNKLRLTTVNSILKSISFNLPKEYQESKNRFDSRKHNADNSWNLPIVNEVLPVYIRNVNDHPESISEKPQAIAYFRKKNENDLADKLTDLNNTYTEDDLKKAIEILLRAIPRCQELKQEGCWKWDSDAKDLIRN